jgi:twinkle protein
MSNIVGDTFCPSCRENGGDKTGNHLMIFADGGAYCKRCNYAEPKGSRTPDGEQIFTGKAMEQKKVNAPTNAEILNDYPYRALESRGISLAAARHYGVRVGLDEANGTDVVEHFYPYVDNATGKLHGYKIRKLPKIFYSNVPFKGHSIQFFGQHMFKNGHKRLLVVGGECDTLAAWDMFNKSDTKFPPAIVGFPQGENVKAFIENKTFIDRFEEVVVCPDQDKAGLDAMKAIVDLLGARVKVMEIPFKDPNEMLLKGKGQDFVMAFWNAKKWKPSGIINVKEVKARAKRMPEWGLPFPWPTLTKLTYGRRRGEGYYIGAGVKIGKSECVNELCQHIIFHDGMKPCVIKTEEEPDMSLKKIAGKRDGKLYHNPEGGFSQEELETAIDSIPDESIEYLYDYHQGVDWEDIKSFIRFAVSDEKCRDVIIDPITAITDGREASDVDVLLKKISRELSEMAKDLGFTYYVFCHLNAPPAGNRPHEEGGAVKSNQFAGSRGMMRACHYMIGIERNKRDPDEVKRNTSRFVLLEDRMFGNHGVFDVYYNRDTGRYLEPNTPGDFS